MTVSYIADVHVANHRRLGGAMVSGINARCRQIIDALTRAMECGNRSESQDLVILGDLFDTTRPTPQVVAEVQAALNKFNGTVYCLVGNHDQQTYAEADHAMASLFPVATIVDRPMLAFRDGYELVLVPYQPGYAPDWLPETLKAMALPAPSAPRALCLHLGVYDATWRPFWAANSHDAVSAEQLDTLMKEWQCSAVFAGNWHTRRTWKEPRIVQVGSLTPTGWDDAGLRGHGLTLWDAATNMQKHIEIEGPRFVKLPAETSPDFAAAIAEVEKYAHANSSTSVYARGVADGPGDRLPALERLQESLPFAAVDVQVDTTIARAEARNASITARSAGTLDEALAGYVKAMPLPDGVDRGAVLAKSKDYLAGAE